MAGHRPRRLDGSYAVMVAGPGVPTGGLEGQYLRKTSDADHDTHWERVAFEHLSGGPYDNDALGEALDGKSSTGHTHDDRYYREDEVDTLLSQLSTALTLLINGKSDTGHTHAYAPDLLVPDEIDTTAYEVTATDRYAAYLCTNAALTTISLGDAAPVGARVRFKAMGAAGFVYAAADGMTLLSAEDFLATPQHGVSEAWRISATQWSILGHVEE